MIEIISIYWIKVLATLVVLLALIILFLRSGYENSNIPGAELVKRELDRLDDNYVVFCNVIIPLERGMSHLSLIHI